MSEAFIFEQIKRILLLQQIAISLIRLQRERETRDLFGSYSLDPPSRVTYTQLIIVSAHLFATPFGQEANDKIYVGSSQANLSGRPSKARLY